MRVALIAATKSTAEGELRAGIRLAGRTVLEWQAQFAIDIGCERIICLCEAPGETVLDLQRCVEAQGHNFHAVRGNLQFASLVRSEDELLMIADGLVMDPSLAAEFVQDGERRGIAVLGEDHPLSRQFPEDFERVDRKRHWGGFALIKATKAHKLGDLPPDHDAISLLLRLALQESEECRDLGIARSDISTWQIASDAKNVAAREAVLVKQAAMALDWRVPGKTLAIAIIKPLRAHHITSGPEVTLGLSAAIGAGALAFAGFGFALTALGLGALACFVATMGLSWRRMRSRLWGRRQTDVISRKSSTTIDAVLTFILLLALLPENGPYTLFSIPLFAIGVSRIASRDLSAKLAAFWSDRSVHMILFFVATMFGYLPEALALFAIGAVLDLLLRKNPT